MGKAFKLNYSTPTNNNQRISSNPRNRQIAQLGMNMGQDRKMQMIGGNGGNQFRQYTGQNAGNLNGYNEVQNVGNQVAQNPRVQNVGCSRAEGNAAGQNGNQIRCYNCRGFGHYARNCTARPRRRDAAYLQTQLLIAQKEEAGIQLQAEEYDLMAAAADLDEIEEVNANCILMANLQQASSSGTQIDSAPVYDSDGSAEVHENCDNNEIFNMFTQEEQYTELLEPIPESHQVPQNDNEVISEVTGVEQGGETVEQHSANFEETRALYESLYQNLAVEVEKVNSVNRKLKETNTDLTTELASTNYLDISSLHMTSSIFLLAAIEADDQAIQTILLGPPEDIYATVDSYETAQEIWLRVQQMMKGSDIGIQEKKAKLFNEWERFTSTNGESIESYYHHDLKAERLAKTQDPLALMQTSNNPYTFPVLHQDQPSCNQNYMQQPIPNLEDITDPTTVISMALTLMAKAFKLNYSTPTNNNQRISSNPRNRQIAQPGMNMGQYRQMQMVGGNGGNQFRQYDGQNVGNLNGYNDVHNVGNQNPNGNGNLVAARVEGNTQLLIAQKEEARIQLQAEEFDLMAAVVDLDEIEEVNANCILMANLQQASTSGTQTDKALVYDSDGSAEVHNYENCYDNEIFNMFTQEEHYTELLEPIPEPHQLPQNDNNVISEVSSVEQSEGTVEQHPANVEETRVLYDSLYNNLAIEVEKVNTVNRKLSEANAELTIELARYKNQEKCFEIRQEKYDKLERYLNKQLSVEKSTLSSLLEEKKKLKSDFKIHEDELLDKQIQLEKKIKELDNILVKTGLSIQTIHMLLPKPDSFYHTEQKMALGYQNPFYLKQA
nr:hypothetical protein [Tanacetum cinerariifolium]